VSSSTVLVLWRCEAKKGSLLFEDTGEIAFEDSLDSRSLLRADFAGTWLLIADYIQIS
jgi:hypothetical protein